MYGRTYPWPFFMLFLRPLFYFFLMVNHKFIWYPIRIYTYPEILCSTQLRKYTYGMWIGTNGDLPWRPFNSGSDVPKGSTLLRAIDEFPKASNKEDLLFNVSVSNLPGHWQTAELVLRPHQGTVYESVCIKELVLGDPELGMILLFLFWRWIWHSICFFDFLQG